MVLNTPHVGIESDYPVRQTGCDEAGNALWEKDGDATFFLNIAGRRVEISEIEASALADALGPRAA